MSDHIFRSWRVFFGILSIVLAYGVRQDQFIELAGLYLLMFIIYLFIGIRYPAFTQQKDPINILIKIILVFAFPLASDDMYRFYWDGCSILDGINPFKYKPHDLILVHPAEWQKTYSLLNSPEYYSVYPPVLQGFFAFCAYCSGHSVYLFSLFWKSILLVSDLGAIHLIRKLDILEKKQLTYWYAWNPLILYEVLVNGHPEGLMIYFIIAFIYFLKTSANKVASLMLGLAAAIKLIPVVIFLFIPKYLGFKSSLRFLIIGFAVFILCMIPVYPFQLNMFESLRLYFGRFEFNGSLFEIWKAIDYRRFGFDNVSHIAPYLSVGFVLWCFFLFFKQKSYDQFSFLKSVSWCWLGYLILSTTVHPWYVLPVLVLGLMSNQFFIIIWSATAILSYSWYDPRISVHWKSILIFIEYTIPLSVFLYQMKYPRYKDAQGNT